MQGQINEAINNGLNYAYYYKDISEDVLGYLKDFGYEIDNFQNIIRWKD